jgi:hypothetical protein
MDNDRAHPAAEPDRSRELTAEVLLDRSISADEEQMLVAALRGCGIAAEAKVIPPRRDPQTLTWIVLVSLPVQAFISAVGTTMAENAYAAFVRAAQRILGRHRQAGPDRPPPVLVLQDPVTGLRIALEPDLPDDAHKQLLTLDLSRYQYGPLHYDRERRRWRSELDEAEARSDS